MKTNIYVVLALVLFASIITLAYVYLLYSKVRKIKINNPKVDEVHHYINEGAVTFLKREYKIIVPFMLGVAVLLVVLGFVPAFEGASTIGWEAAICFVIGASFSALAGWIGMHVATKANARTAVKAQEEGMSGALKVAFSGGAVLGLAVAGLGLLGLTMIFAFSYLVSGNLEHSINILSGYSLGCSMISLFARVGGGIYTKAADVGADLVGKVEAGIPEDDPRNPATIADNVGDNVGDVAGMGADLTESFVGSIVSCLTTAFLLFQGSLATNYRYLLFALIIAGVGLIASVCSILFIRIKNWDNPKKALNIATYFATGLVVIATILLSLFYVHNWKLIISVVVGLVSGIAIGYVAEVYTSSDYPEVKKIAEESQTGHATNIISGFGSGMKSTFLTIIILVVVIAVAYFTSGEFGIALAAVGMLSTTGITVSVDGYGPISDNAGGIAQMSELPSEVREITDKLDSVGNTTAAIGKGFSIGSATLTALAFIVSYINTAKISGGVSINISLDNPAVLVGVLVGAMLPYFFSALAISAVGRAANKMVEEVRNQFANDPGILAGTSIPDYNRCIDISTRSSLHEMILPGVVAVFSPILCGFALGVEGLGGALIGGLVSSIMLAVFMANAGGAWDNAKKYIEEGYYGGKGSDTHKAAVTGDTVGDPLKDTAGPAMNILIKLMTIISLVMVPILVRIPSLWDLLVNLFNK